mgnify:CR=1 FL=1
MTNIKEKGKTMSFEYKNGSIRHTDAVSALFSLELLAKFNHLKISKILAVDDKTHKRTALVPSLQACSARIDVQTT